MKPIADLPFPRSGRKERPTTGPRELVGTVSELLTLADEMDDLAAQCIGAWLRGAPDPRGGVYGHLDRQMRPVFDKEGNPQGPSGEHRGDKSLIQISRHLYAYSLMARRRERTTSLEKLSRSCFDLLAGVFRLSDNAPYVHQVDSWHEPRDSRFQLYAQSFAIFGLSAYSRAFEDQSAGEMALALFRVVDKQRHDRKHGGYEQTQDGGWLAHVNAPLGANKCTNTHIHVLEALTELSHCFPREALVIERLRELTEILATRMTQPEGYVAKFFDGNWQPVGPLEVSYGHDIETSWLLREAANRLVELGHPESHPPAFEAANRIANHALAAGWDPQGGVFDTGLPLSFRTAEPQSLAHVSDFEKVWWAQAEALPGIYSLFQATREPHLVRRLSETFAFLRDKSFDETYGEFFWGVDSDGKLGSRGDHKGELWKTPYHGVRALILTADWIRADHQPGS